MVRGISNVQCGHSHIVCMFAADLKESLMEDPDSSINKKNIG